MADQTTTPAEVIAALSAERAKEPIINRHRRVGADVIAALAAAGFVVRPLPDEEQRRAHVSFLTDLASEIEKQFTGRGQAQLRYTDPERLRAAAAFLTEGPQG